jgi:hypothetical protein
MFAIYFPGKTGYTDQHLKDAGLGDLLDDVAPSFTDFLPGPDGGPGIAATWFKERPITVGDFEWSKCQRSEVGGQKSEFWFGRLLGEKPRPEWFARARQQLGSDVAMADGQKWHIPIARQLPQLLQLDGQGEWRPTIAASYKQFWDEAWDALNWLVPGDDGKCRVDFRVGAEFVAHALSINYRVNRDVASWLGLIRSDLFFEMARAVTEFDQLLEAQKKTAANAGVRTSAGAGG